MNSELPEESGAPPHLIERLACEVSSIPTKRLTGKDVLRPCQRVFLDVEEAADLLRVKPKTVSTRILKARFLFVMQVEGPPFCSLHLWAGHYLKMTLIPP
jgi:hypothetical protein